MADLPTVALALLEVEQKARDIGSRGWIDASQLSTVSRIELFRLVDAEYLKADQRPPLVWIVQDGKQRRAMTPSQRRWKTRLQDDGRVARDWMQPAEKVLWVSLTETGVAIAMEYVAARGRTPLPDSLQLSDFVSAIRRQPREKSTDLARRQASLRRRIQRRVSRVAHGVYRVGDVLLHCGRDIDAARLPRTVG